jgi:GNAT superfamily N-acetyltransferase
MRFVDAALAYRFESTDAYAGVEYARTHLRLHPEAGATSIPVAGGHAIFAGVDSPLTQAFALGLSGPVAEDEIDRMEDFYRSRGVAVNVELCPYADPSIITIFRERGYTVIEYSNVLARELKPGEKFLLPDGRLSARKVEPGEGEMWARTVARGFAESEEVPSMVMDFSTTFVNTPAHACFLAEIDGVAAGGGLVTINDKIASLAATATAPSFRNQGAQTALIQARLAYAAAEGCELAMVTTMPGTVSQRNVQRQGFDVVYSRSKLMLEQHNKE